MVFQRRYRLNSFIKFNNERYYQQQEHFVFSDRSNSTTTYNEFTPTMTIIIVSEMGHYEYLLNGIEQLSNVDQTQSSRFFHRYNTNKI